jgi:nitrile hydratase accessory protein
LAVGDDRVILCATDAPGVVAGVSKTSPIAPLASRDGGPAFDEPWQAEVLALAGALSESGVFTPAQWSEALGAALRQAEARGAPDGHATYYGAVLEALEQLLAATGGITADALAHRIEEWRRAYLQTPHGQPVELAAGAGGSR